MKMSGQERGFSLAEAVIGIGLATVLILSIVALTTAALSGDQKAEKRQIALSLADSELHRFSKAVGLSGSTPRQSFWSATDGTYTGSGALSELTSGGTAFTLEYEFSTVTSFSENLGHEQPRNRLRKVDLKVSWWEGEQGKPGYGRLAVVSSRLIREADVREP